VAGLLHDLGKLAVSEEIIMKPGSLTEEEFNQIKQHTYYTYWLLKPAIPNLPLVEWAAYHHERIDGQGYPFKKSGNELDIGSRLMSIADIFTALREDRPYRKGLEWPAIESIIHKQVSSGAIDGELASILFENHSKIDQLWEELLQSAN
jgi:HD-GYP domain-containing protein (c-di-GMP phosphodiesterase class II)